MVPDPRVERTRHHHLLDILTIALCATICGADSFVGIAEWGRAKEGWLRERLGLALERGIPSHDTFGRVFARLDVEAFNTCLLRWSRALAEGSGGQVIAIDGKQLRHSFDTATGKAALQSVSAWACQSRLTLAQRRVETGSNEITAVPALLELLDISGCTVTLDAMGCQKGIAKKIVEGGGQYVLSLKKNHGNLYETVEKFFTRSRALGWRDGFGNVAHRYSQSVEKGHGRIETRRLWLVEEKVGWVDPDAAWEGLKSIVCIERERRVGKKPATVEVRYFLSSLGGVGSAKKVLRTVRRHWEIENRLHWVLDVVFGEDGCRVRNNNAPENLATLRRLSLSLLQQEKQARLSLAMKRARAGWDESYLLQVLLAGARPDPAQS